MLLNGFNANEVEPNGTFEPVPADWYQSVITASEEKQTKAGTGSYLELKMEIIDGEYKGRLLFERLNLNNPNQTAVDIAQGTLSAICRATGVMTPSDSSDLHDKPMMVKVVVKPASGDYAAGNECKAYEAVGGQAKAETPKAADNTPPWKRG